MDQYCVAIDPVFSAKAFKVPYKGWFETLPYITTSGRFQQRCFHYIAGPSGEKLLTISMRAARESKPGFQVPSKKILVVRSLMNEKPTKIASTQLNAAFVVMACRVQVDFAQRTLTMQIPSTDWLFKHENERYLLRLQQSPMYTPVNDTVLNLVVVLGSPPDDELVSGQLHLMGEVGERLGLARGEILRIADSLDYVRRP
ncbi:MAG: hypothetical protein Q9195_002459 [Heterodermia aff. obscurata]